MAYPIFKEYDNLLDVEDIESINKRTELYSLKDAQIFNKKTQENTRDDTIRKCKEVYIKDKSIINWIDKMVTHKLNTVPGVEFVMVKNNVRILEYDPSDFFSKHTDVVNVGSNMFKNYSLLICLDPCVSGGETVLYPSGDDSFAYSSDKTCRQRGAGLIFPKTVLHEGKPIVEGKKRVMFLNYNCYLKDQDYIIVTTVSDGGVFAIPAKVLENVKCTLTDYYKEQKELHSDQRFFLYDENEMSGDEFNIFYKDIFGQGDFDFDNYEMIKDKMEHLCYRMRDLDNYDIGDETYEILPKSCTSLIKDVGFVGTTNAIFEMCLYSIFNCKFVHSLYINGKFVFCNANIKMDIYDNLYDWNSDCEKIIAFEDDYHSCVICKTVNCCNGHEGVPFLHIDVDLDFCFDCLSKFHKKYLKSHDLTQDDIGIDEDILKNLNNFFKNSSDETKIGICICGNNDEYGLPEEPYDEENTISIDPNIDRVSRSKKDIEKSVKGLISGSKSGCDCDNEEILKNFDVFKFLKKIIYDTGYTSNERMEEAYWAGKSNHTAIYNVSDYKGVVKLDKYLL